MAYPDTIDDFPAPGQTLSSAPHRAATIQAQSAIVNIESTIGVGPANEYDTVKQRMNYEGRKICTSDNRPAHLEGREIYETDTGRTFTSVDGAWKMQTGPELRVAHTPG